jgi:pilus assembly protein CpaC
MRISTRVVRVVFLILILVWAPSGIVFAGDDMPPVRLLVGRSMVIDVGTPISRVSLTSADIADAMVTTGNQLLVNGKMPGTITMFVWERAGALRQYEITVMRDLAILNEQMVKLFPGETILAQSNGKSVVLSGLVTSKDAADKAMNVAAGYVEKAGDVVNLLKLQETLASNQVLLRVRFAEVSRSAVSELGVSLFTSPTGVKNTLVRATTDQFSGAPGFSDLKWTKENGKFGSDVTSAEGKFTFSDFLNLFLFSEKFDIGAAIKALQTKGLFQSLAEPNLVAESGKEASFLAGGEVPIPIAQGTGGSNAISVTYKEFGVRLSFTPTVIGNRVHLKVKPEVSTLDFANGVNLQGFRIPALSTRRTETELELLDGQTFAIAGLMNNSMNTTMSKIPGIGDIPILGLLFKSKAAQKNQTELVVMITPHILPRNSPGVTPNLPRIQEPYMPAMPANKTMEMPPPAFGARPSGVAVATPGQQQPAAQPAGDNAAAAAATVRALTPSRPTAYVPGTTELPATQTVGTVTATSATPIVRKERRSDANTATGTAVKPAPEQDERARAVAARGRAKQDARNAKAEAANTKVEQANAKVEEERQAKLAKEQARKDVEQAKKDAEAARVAAIEAKKQAEVERIHQQVVDEAAAKVKAAEAKYQELLKQKSR